MRETKRWTIEDDAKIGRLLRRTFQPSAWRRLVRGIRDAGFDDLDPDVYERLDSVGDLLERGS